MSGMSEYIEREALLRLYDPKSLHGIPNPDAFNVPFYVVRQNILDIPAADVRPVVRGEWYTTDAFPHHVYCSVCHKTYIPNDRWQIWVDGDLPRDFCPHCGADMRTEK